MLLTLIVVLVSTVITLTVWDNLRKKRHVDTFAKSHIDGPRALPILGCGLEVLHIGAETIIPYIGECFKKYGKTIRIWILNEAQVYTCDIRLFETVLSSSTLLQKGDVYDLLRTFLNDGLLLSVGKKWHARRKIFTPAFHFSVLEDYVKVFDEQSTILARKLDTSADGKTIIDIFGKVSLAALDAITETAMGVKVNAQLDPEFPYVTALKRVVYVQPGRILKFTQRYNWLFKLIAPLEYRKMMADIKIMHDFTIKVIEERRAALESSIAAGTYKPLTLENDGIGSKKQMALLDILLQSQIDGKPLSNEDIREEVDTFMFEGDDTTTSGVSHALYCISRHPHVQQQLFTEILEVLGNDKNAAVTMKQLQELKYMECVIKETLRLHPPVPAIGRKTEKDLVLGDKLIPANTSIYLVTYFAQRDPDNFSDPECFKPERFADLVIDSNLRRNTFTFTPFSAGARNCIGQKFAMLEMKAMISKMLRCYEILPLGRNVEPMMNFILRSSVGVNIGLKTRIY